MNPDKVAGKEVMNIPRHVAIIMDGNGRWARRQGFSRKKGHAEGAESVRVITRECASCGVEQLTLFAFSTENWRRPRTEVGFLMTLLRRFLISSRNELTENNIRLKVIGRTDALNVRVRKELQQSMDLSARNTGMILRLALNYGARQEILDAACRLAVEINKKRIDPAALKADDFARFLYDDEMTDPDILIRTGGDVRVSNFLLWQISYSELWFTDVCWPEFRAVQLRKAFRSYSERERRYGGLSRKPVRHQYSSSKTH